MTLINQTPLIALKAVIDLGLELDEPIAPQPAAAAVESPPAPAAEPTPDQPKPAFGTGLSWQTARDRLIARRRSGESFTSLRDLAARVGCSEGLIRKAIKRDTGLRAWAASASRTRPPTCAPRS
jgi:AraC-like DNA-binding protein